MKKYRTSSIILILSLYYFLAGFQQISGITPVDVIATESEIPLNPVIIDTLDFIVMDPATGIQFYKNGIIVLSNSKYQQKMIPDHISFGKNGTFLIQSSDLESFYNKMFISGNPFPVNPVGIAFSPDYKILYYTAPAESGRNTEQIYSVPINDSQNSSEAYFNSLDIKLMPFCNENDNYGYPTISADNSFLIFASDNSKSMGGFDLFIVKREGSKWGEPSNMGKSINTNKDELYPFLDNDGNLFFSSEGHTGFGGMDIYMCRFIDDGWGSPVNLMNTFNSEYDDVALKIDADNQTGYFTTINMPGKKKKQLYKITPSESGKLSDAVLLQAQNEYKRLFNEEMAGATDEKVTSVATAETKAVKEEPAAVSPQAQAAAPPATGTGGQATGAAAVAAGTTAAVVTAAAAEKEPKKVEEKPVVKEPVETPAAAVVAVDDTKTVYFRIQITSSSTPKSNYRVTIDGKSYPTFEYLYKGAYRYTVGNFRSVSEAKAFQTKCRNSGFSQAFVAAFINDVRETDPAVFKQ